MLLPMHMYALSLHLVAVYSPVHPDTQVGQENTSLTL
jgi:hypothetical protein